MSLFPRIRLLIGDRSIKNKLTFVTMLVCSLTAVILSGAFIVNDIFNVRDRLLRELNLAANIVGERTASRMAFLQADKAEQDLIAFSHKPSVMLACLYGTNQELFAKYQPTPNLALSCPTAPGAYGYRFTRHHLMIHHKISDPRYEDSGSLYIVSNLNDVYEHITQSILIILVVLTFVLICAYIIAGWLQHIISHPIFNLVETTRQVAQGARYSVRANKYYHDEIGELSDSFNSMMAQIEDANNTLENKVRERTHELEQATILAETANQAKTEFLRNMSHEFRTPLHAMSSFSIYGMKESETATREELNRYFVRISNGTDRLLKLVEGLLALAKLESGKESFTLGKGDLQIVAETVIAEEQSLIKDKKIQVELVPTSLDTHLVFDNDKMIQVVTNIIGNAIKFTPEGKKITIAFEPHQFQDPTTLNHVRPGISLLISDQGIGIPEEELNKIFDKFVQSSRTKTGAGGTGLGLAIAQNIMTGHEGTIRAVNNPEGGCTFIISLPYGLPEGKKVVTFTNNKRFSV